MTGSARVGGDDDVHVADRLREAAERSAVRRACDTPWHLVHAKHDCASPGAARRRWASAPPSPARRAARATPRSHLLGLLAEPLERADLVLRRATSGGQIVVRLDPQLGAERLHRLRPEALDAQERHDAPRVLLPQGLEFLDLAGLEELANFSRPYSCRRPRFFCSSFTVSLPRSEASAPMACAALSYARTRKDCGSPSSSIVSSARSRSISRTSCFVSAGRFRDMV